MTVLIFTMIVFINMNVLVLGGGGREHAIVKALKLSPKVKHISCAQGNPGISQDATCYLTDPADIRKVIDLAKRIKPDVVVIGPEGPLAAGVSDALRLLQFNVFGPSQRAAQLETSKVFSKKFMEKYSIPTAAAIVCTSKEELLAAKEKSQGPWVVKADGLAAGKGVRICENAADFNNCVKDFFEKKTLGAATDKVLLEEFIDGEELSLMCLVADGHYEVLPISQDHKKLLDHNRGPNTGGMGAFAPVKQWSKKLTQIIEKVVEPTITGMKKEHFDYRGVLYIGVMMKKDQPYVLEYNVRFGDPEAQALLPLLDGDWGQVFNQVALGKMPKLAWKKQAAVCVVLTASGYPENPQKGAKILIDRNLVKPDGFHYLLHASTASHQGYYTNGGRVLNAVGIDKTLKSARKKAYDLIKGVTFEGMHYRKDIAEEKS